MTVLNPKSLPRLIIFIFILTACNFPGLGGGPTATLNAEQLVQTALAQTAAASAGDPEVATSVAGTLAAMGVVDEQPAATLPPGIIPSDTVPPIVPTDTPSIPIIQVSVNTNCRYGPSVIYDPPVDVFLVGETAQVFGRSPDGNFYYIDKGCYVWNNYVIVQGGNINSVPVFTPMPTPTYTPTVEPLPWAGVWNTNCAAGTCDQMILEQTGGTVTGSYAGADGQIGGTVSGNHLTGTWTRGGGSGTIDFWMNPAENRWHGNYDQSRSWCGSREGLSYLNPCGVSSWYGTWVTNCAPVDTCGSMTLTQNGVNVSGSYASGAGSVSGTVNGTVFSGNWTHGGNGSFAFYMLTNGNQFRGNWNTSNYWCGYRNAAGHPAPCLQN